MLVADDHAAVRGLLVATLRRDGYKSIQLLLRRVLHRHCDSVDVANDGERALQLLGDRVYDVVILDIMLPKVNGFEVAARLDNLARKPRLIVLSAIARYFEDRFPPGTTVLQKPFDLDRIGDRGAAGRVAAAPALQAPFAK